MKLSGKDVLDRLRSRVFCRLRPSKIHGIGVFALRKILKEEIIGLGSVDGTHKTILGRYTNHSDDNNAMFYYLKAHDVVMVAGRDIDKDEEILINYRDHVLNEKYL